MRARIWITSSAVAAVAMTTLAMSPARAEQPTGPKFAMERGHVNTLAGVKNLVDHGGPVLPAADLYAIWWGPASGFPADAQSRMTTFFTGFGSSDLLQIARQYMHGAKPTATYVRAFFDTSTPTAKPSSTGLAAEIKKVLDANKTSADPNGIYVVFTSTFPKGSSYCAWHNGATVNGKAIAEAFMPNPDGVQGCATPNDYPTQLSPISDATRSLADSTSHELMESITDPQPNGNTLAWIDNGGGEIADKCEWLYGGPVSIGGLNWEVQEEWSNAISGCVQYSQP
jgi:hypothetical protein